MGFRQWVYHATEEPKIIDSEDFESEQANGWEDSPAKFIKVTDFGIEPDDELALQQLGDSVEGVKDSLNGALNIDLMDKQELSDYAKKHYDADYDLRKYRGKKGLKQLRLDVKALTEAEYDHSETGDIPGTH